MSSDFSPELRKELLDDFYAECDELLTNLREALVKIQQSPAASQSMPATLESVFRCTHSLKGICAIAGVRQAEQLAHAMEEVIRSSSARSSLVSPEHSELLLDAAQGLEKIVTAHRLGRPTSVRSDLIESLSIAAGRSGVEQAPILQAQEPSGAPIDPIESARARGLQPWRATFAPSVALDERGVNVSTIRERLSRIGEIVNAVPTVRPNASIVFVFTVALRAEPVGAEREVWAADSVQLEPILQTDATNAARAPAPNRPSDPDGLSLAPAHMVRVDLRRLDDLMRITGDLVIQRFRLEERIQREFDGDEALKEIDLGFFRSLRELRSAIARARLVPVAEVFTRMPFVVRDLAAQSEKKARVELEGPHTEIDKFVVERLKDPLLHLVRNAFSHGIETPAERASAGKASEGTILLRAMTMGDSVVIQVRDDGRGIDAEAIITRAKALGMALPERVDARALLEILCAPGFSTREHADHAAGRGVGMSVVATTVRELGGTLTLDTTLGAGTEFTLRLPLTVSIIEAVIVTAGTETCAVPQSSIAEIIQIAANEARHIRDTEVVPYRDGLLPILRLRSVFGMEATESALLTVLVLSAERGARGLVVDRVHARREVVVRPLTDPLVRVSGISGATELGDGRPILILDPNALTHGVVRPPSNVAQTIFSQSLQ